MSKNQELESIIGPSVKIKGDFSSHGDIQIEGALDGSLSTSGDIKVGKDAKIQANVTANNIFISGTIQGTIKATTAILSNTARIVGDIETKNITIEDGALFNGKCSMGEAGGKANEKTTESSAPDQETEKNK